MIGVIGLGAESICAEGVRLMSHRGKRERIASGGFWSIGHRRLPIVGLGVENDQPISWGRWTIAFVGEILNYKEMPSPAIKWSDGDLSTVVSEWVNEGPPGFRRFDGFWAVLAYDHGSGKMHCLTDYLAQKPMYIRHGEKDGKRFGAVASEIAPLAAIGLDEPNKSYLSSCVKWGYDPNPYSTPYNSITKIPPGMCVVFGESGIDILSQVDYLRPAASAPSGDYLKQEIELAVRRRVTSSDVPVACLVSGGLDSSITYCLAKRHGDIAAYTIEVGDNKDGLEKLIEGGSQVERVIQSTVGIERCLHYMQEPIDLGSLVPQTELSDALAASWGGNVCLTGDGADELFGGYPRAARYDSQYSDVYCELVRWHLPRLDRVMMRNMIEVRSPFLARRVAQMALALPREQRINKRILRELFKDDLPDGIAEAPKTPLKSSIIQRDRELNSFCLVDLFTKINPYYRKGSNA
jgi:asparagine synthase (glutamine-hydrolysing)